MTKYSTNIIGTLDNWAVVVDTYIAEAEKINKNEHLSPLGKSEARKKLDREMEEQQALYEKKWETAWEQFRKDTSLTGTSKPEERQSAMQTILALGKDLTPDIFADIVEPLKKDVSALRQIQVLMEKVGASENIETSKTFDIIRASKSLEEYTKQAEQLGSQIMKDQDTSLTYGIRKQLLSQMIEGAEKQLAIINS